MLLKWRGSTIILETIFKLVALCSYRDCICFELQFIGSCKSTICYTVHPSMQLCSAQKWCMCLPWALWGSHSLFSLCPHWAAQIVTLLDKSQEQRSWGPLAVTFPCCIWCALGADVPTDASPAIPGLEERIWSFTSSTGIKATFTRSVLKSIWGKGRAGLNLFNMWSPEFFVLPYLSISPSLIALGIFATSSKLLTDFENPLAHSSLTGFKNHFVYKLLCFSSGI